MYQDAEERGASLTLWQLLLVLKPYFWPRGPTNRVRAVATYVILGGSKAANIAAPLFIQSATNGLMEGDYRKAVRSAGLYCLLVLLSKCLREVQSVVYLKVQQVAFIEIYEQTYMHIHSLVITYLKS